MRHLANESVKASGSRVGDSIGAHMAPPQPTGIGCCRKSRFGWPLGVRKVPR